jgi:hypothetical protein
MNSQPGDHQAVQVRVVVDEENRPRLARTVQRRCKLDTRGTGTVDGHGNTSWVTVFQIRHEHKPENPSPQGANKE